MYLIQPRLTSNSLTNDGLNQLLCDLDSKILSLAMTSYLNDLYGFQDYVDYNLYYKLCTYKEILLDKLMGCNCFTEKDFLINITSRIQKLVNGFC